jgi:hypothetical protein
VLRAYPGRHPEPGSPPTTLSTELMVNEGDGEGSGRRMALAGRPVDEDGAAAARAAEAPAGLP